MILLPRLSAATDVEALQFLDIHELPGRAAGYPNGSPTDPDERN